MKKILVFSEVVTLAHIARSVAIVEALHNTGIYSVALAADSRYDFLFPVKDYAYYPIYSIGGDVFFKKLDRGLPIYDSETLVDYIKDDLRVIEDYRPDFIIGDFRLSLAVSSKLTNIPYATITNAYWSPYADINYVVPEIQLTKVFGVNFSQALFDFARPLVFWFHSLDFNKVCEKFGLQALAYDMREIYTHADFTLYADIESLFYMKDLPKNHHFIGPILWSVNVSLPSWWSTFPENKPIVFVTLGSSGDTTLLPMILDTLRKLDVVVICVTACKAFVKSEFKNVFIADFLPVQLAVKISDIVICNGGSPMVYQSLALDKPVIGLPSNLDQYLMMSVLQQNGRGQLIRSGQATPDKIRLAVEQAMTNSSPSLAAECNLRIDRIIELIDGK